MKKLYSSIAIVFLFLLGLTIPAQLHADVHKRVVLQAFWWDY